MPKHKPIAAKKEKPIQANETRLLTNIYGIAEVAIGQKALDVSILKLGNLTDIADYFIIASGTSDRHVKGIADKITIDLENRFGETPISVSGYEHGEWVLLDYGDYVVHVFYEPTRQFYNLDDLWKEAERVPLPPEVEKVARALRTGLYR